MENEEIVKPKKKKSRARRTVRWIMRKIRGKSRSNADKKPAEEVEEEQTGQESSRKRAMQNQDMLQLMSRPPLGISGIMEEDINLMTWLHGGNTSPETAHLMRTFIEWRCAFTRTMFFQRRKTFPASLLRLSAFRAARINGEHCDA